MHKMTDPATQYLDNLARSIDQGRTLAPVMASVAVTTRCNSKCKYCGIWTREATDLSLDDLKLAVDQLSTLGVQVVSLTGGEPLLHQELEQVLLHIRARGMISSVTTNGMLIRPELLQSLLAAGLNSTSISLDTIDPETYATIRGVPIEPVLRGLECTIREVRDFAKHKISANCVVSKANIGHIERLVQYCTERGVFVGFQPIHGLVSDGLAPSFVFTEQDLPALHALVDRLLRMQEEGYLIRADIRYLQGFPDFLVYRSLPRGFVCTAGFTTVAIDQTLNVKSCWSMPPVGNLHSAKLSDLWHSKIYAERRSVMMKLNCPGCWYRCHTEYCSEDWLRRFLSWVHLQKAS